jgi:pimeloyl-ACP methyl ester carboxylesterase
VTSRRTCARPATRLTGLGERAHLLDVLGPRVDLETHVADIVGLLEYEDLRDAVLVGHSYAGMVVAGGADRAAERVSQLIYLDAFVPADGQSLFDLLAPERRAHFQEQARDDGGGWRVPPPSPAALGITDQAQARWVAARLTVQPLRTFEQPIALAGAPPATRLPRTYVHCTDSPVASSFAPFAARLRGAAGWRYHELATAHAAMVTQPAAVAEVLLAPFTRGRYGVVRPALVRAPAAALRLGRHQRVDPGRRPADDQLLDL